MAERLMVYEDRGVYRIGWYLPDDDDMGITLGEDLRDIARCNDKEHKAATQAIKDQEDMELDDNGFYWESKSKAQVALKIAKQAVKDLDSGTQMPEWAKQALAAGWKAPKGWKP
jgi:hypothetical protein